MHISDPTKIHHSWRVNEKWHTSCISTL